MAVKPVDRIRTMITDLERGARTLGDDIRKRAGKVDVTSDLESALRQLLQGLTTIAAQLEKAAGELRRYLEQSSKAEKSRGRAGSKAKGGAKKKAKRKPAARTKKAAAVAAVGKKSAGKSAQKKSAAKTRSRSKKS